MTDEEMVIVRFEGETHVFWPLDDPMAEWMISLSELVEFAGRNGEASERFLRMRRLH